MSGRAEKIPTSLTHKVQTDGEITINLVLTIKLEGNNLSISHMDKSGHSPVTTQKEDVDLIVPNFEINEIIEFGEDV